ncbi:phosphopantetheinyl transferase [Paenalcaligenes hominis]|uniref:Phosphopantetheinyl transferase n=1 Tax=Paenalcaligenes hominis TaxID=643674 RepID=A0ABX0WQG1_9BURK|nr:4'-phosphopantetheinyl transferase superfamily protein [Paenalcaligenes hominis]NJB65077.1 phosphopantetheinyl transferase [Paenalcaligenes hominis]
MVELYVLDRRQTPSLAQLRSAVTEAEWVHAQGFRTHLLQTRYLASRAFLRHHIGQRLQIAPLAVTITLGAYQKPLLTHAPWHFSLSHSRDITVLALAPHVVGVDIEHTDTPFPAPLAPLLLHPHELPIASNSAELYRHWCSKEAVLKAYGTGLQTDPRHILLTQSQASLFEHTYYLHTELLMANLLCVLAQPHPFTSLKRHDGCAIQCRS